ncbi:MAG: hypothetical protein A2Z29_09700 [Chloroflexi bacterium RBG_16_56_11]|nr:MAG: hypothetical protein A2Z29_09700 [Chloroflexi bacterium RBG_16_56_11]
MTDNRNFDWLAVIIYPLAVVLMEAFWVYPWLAWVGSWPVFEEPRPALSLVSVIIVLAVSLLSTRLIIRRPWPLRLTQAVIIGGGLVAILVTLRLEYAAGYTVFDGGWFTYVGQVLESTFTSPGTLVLALPALLYLWWRGIRLGQTTSYFRDIYRSFLLGLVALIVLIIFWQISSSSESIEPPGADIGWNVVGFFFFGLLAIAICHLYLMRSSMPREDAALTSVRRWLPVMLGVIGGMVVVVFGLGSIFSEEFFTSVGHGAGAVFSALGKVFNFVLIPLNYLFEGIFWLFRWLINLLQAGRSFEPGTTDNMTLPDTPEVTLRALPPEVTMIIKWVVIAVLVAVVVFLLARAISRARDRRHREDIDEVHESLWSWQGLGDDLRLLLGMMKQKFRRKPAPAAVKIPLGDDVSKRLDVREIYRHLQSEAARSGMPRHGYETAREYTLRLRLGLTDSDEHLREITELYGDVRYGEIIAPENRVDDANVVWRTLRGMFRRLRGE